jgi:hypothetical protein
MRSALQIAAASALSVEYRPTAESPRTSDRGLPAWPQMLRQRMQTQSSVLQCTVNAPGPLRPYVGPHGGGDSLRGHQFRTIPAGRRSIGIGHRPPSRHGRPGASRWLRRQRGTEWARPRIRPSTKAPRTFGSVKELRLPPALCFPFTAEAPPWPRVCNRRVSWNLLRPATCFQAL